MGVKEYKFSGDDRHLLNEYHRQLDSLGEWQINFTPAKTEKYWNIIEQYKLRTH